MDTTEVLADLATFVRGGPPSGCNVVRSSLPFPWFGDLGRATAAVVALNPNEDLTKCPSLQALGLDVYSDLRGEEVRRLAERCTSYFESPNCNRDFFKLLEEVLLATGHSYGLTGGAGATAVHLDISPWQTAPVWGELNEKQRLDLRLNAEALFIGLLRKSAVMVLYANGNGAGGQLVQTGRRINAWSTGEPKYISGVPDEFSSLGLQSGTLHLPEKAVTVWTWSKFLPREGPDYAASLCRFFRSIK